MCDLNGNFELPRPKPNKCNPKPPKPPVQNCPKPFEKPPIAPSEYGYLTGDPHLRGGDGELYDITPLPGTVYSVLKDKGLHYKAQMDTINEWGAVGVTQSSIRVQGQGKANIIEFDARGNAFLITKKGFKSEKTPIEKGTVYNLADGGTVQFAQALGGGSDGSQMEERLVITTKEGYIITQVARERGYIDSNVETGAKGVYSDRVMPKGILGDTFDKGNKAGIPIDDKGTGVLKRPLSSYERKKL